MTGPPSNKVVSSPDGSVQLEILSAIQAPKCKADGQIFVAVYTAKYQNEEVILKVFLSAGIEAGSPRARTEITAFQRLTDRGCIHAPRLLASWERRPESVLGLVEHYMVMTKIPGVTIPTALQQGGSTEKIKKAFQEAIEDVHNCGVDNGAHGHHQGNALYDLSQDTCFILDFDKGDVYEDPDQIDPSYRDIRTWFREWHDGWDGRLTEGSRPDGPQKH